MDTSGGNVVINLSELSAGYGEDMKFSFVKTTGDANTITINPGGSDTINGAGAAYVIDTINVVVDLVGDSATSDWLVVLGNTSVSDNSLTLAKLQQISDLRVLGNVSGGTANVSELTSAQVTANMVDQATEGAAGKAEIATQAETDAGTDDTKMVTPLKLANFSGLGGSGAGGGGGSIVTSAVDIVLTAASDQVQQIEMTTTGKRVTLPDATTLNEGATQFVIKCTGASFSVYDDAGGLLKFMSLGEIVTLSLVDGTTAAGKWLVDKSQGLVPSPVFNRGTFTAVTPEDGLAGLVSLTDDKILFLTIEHTADTIKAQVGDFDAAGALTLGSKYTVHDQTVTTNRGQQYVWCIALDSTRVACFYLDDDVDQCKGVILTVAGTVVTVGTIYTINTGKSIPVDAVLLSTDKVLLATRKFSASTTSAEFIAMTISGSVITAGTQVAQTFSSSTNWHTRMAQIDADTVMAVSSSNNGSAPEGYVVSVSGTVVTVNTETQLSGVEGGALQDQNVYMIDATNGFIIWEPSSAGEIKVSEFSISGTTVTLGTETDAVSNNTATFRGSFKLGDVYGFVFDDAGTRKFKYISVNLTGLTIGDTEFIYDPDLNGRYFYLQWGADTTGALEYIHFDATNNSIGKVQYEGLV